jgi:peptidoglycan/LPS O-acetylase OafA/YrhL
MTSDPRPQRQVGPDLLRALAILLVTSWHFPNQDDASWLWTLWQQFGWFGVDIFFVLSGYLIGAQLLKRVRAGAAPDLRTFYVKRAFRILPMFWLTLALYVLVPALREAPAMAAPWRFLTFTMNFGFDVRATRAFSHAWSLCVEEHFYVVLPLLILALRRAARPWLPAAVALSMVLGGMWLRHSLWTTWDARGDADTVAFMKAIYYPSTTRLDGLILGVSLAAVQLFHPDAWRRYVRPAWTLPLSIACLGVAGWFNVRDGFVPGEAGVVLMYPLFALGVTLLLAALLELEPHLQALRWTGAGWIAAISYSMYLSQKMVFHADVALLPEAWTQGWVGAVVFYVTAIAVASVLYVAVERPFLRLRDRVLAR